MSLNIKKPLNIKIHLNLRISQSLEMSLDIKIPPNVRIPLNTKNSFKYKIYLNIKTVILYHISHNRFWPQPAALLKRRFFFVNFAKFVKITFLIEQRRWLPLK